MQISLLDRLSREHIATYHKGLLYSCSKPFVYDPPLGYAAGLLLFLMGKGILNGKSEWIHQGKD